MSNQMLLLLVFAVILLIILVASFFILSQILKKEILNTQKFIYEQNQNSVSLINDVNDSLKDNFYIFNKSLNDSVTNSNITTTNTLTGGIDSLDKRFKHILDKINELESANNSAILLKNEVMKLNSIFSNHKLRGNFGEFELYKILKLSYGDNSKFYKTQYKLKNDKIVDAALFLKSDLILGIDSKFPLSSYQKICKGLDNNENILEYQKEFVRNLKKHIDDISNKYIISGQTVKYAIMFLPSEAIFNYICSNFSELFEYMVQKSVFLASPTNLLVILNYASVFIKDENINKNISSVKNEIFELSKIFEEFKKQGESVLNSSNKLNKNIEIFYKNSNLIYTKFKNIEKF